VAARTQYVDVARVEGRAAVAQLNPVIGVESAAVRTASRAIGMLADQSIT
jgi:hypothetical protein